MNAKIKSLTVAVQQAEELIAKKTNPQNIDEDSMTVRNSAYGKQSVEMAFDLTIAEQTEIAQKTLGDVEIDTVN